MLQNCYKCYEIVTISHISALKCLTRTRTPGHFCLSYGVYARGELEKAASWKLKGELHNVDNRSWDCNSWIDEHGIRWNSGGAYGDSTRGGAHGARRVGRGSSRTQAQ